MVHLRVVSDDRRERQREKKRSAMLEAAGRLIDRDGLAGVTMQGVADELDIAVGTIYLYFPSKAALVAALQSDAVGRLRASYDTASPAWGEFFEREGLDNTLRVLAQLCAFGSFFASASVVFADEWQMQRHLLSERVAMTSRHEVRDALPVVEALLDRPMVLIREAVDVQVIEGGDDRERALLWLAALNGVLPLENLALLDRHLFRSQHLARSLTHDLLTGWGADRADVEVAASHVERLAALGPMAPPPSGPGFG